ncbi:hypothetical protein [uncultured Tateyamaria sp.]|uniref:hypothetical protein n=1 Tax=uncultured Tateyamaria sp. TaxID=455651 RepID=UPI00260F0DB8|nr:hypothetical protein [uncultured Tateyamaria sp.]
MKELLLTAFKSIAAAFAVLVGLAFTPLDWVPMMLSFAFLGWSSTVILLLIAGAPCAGFLAMLATSKKGARLEGIAGWAGMWVGALTGSWVGLTMSGKAPWI